MGRNGVIGGCCPNARGEGDGTLAVSSWPNRKLPNTMPRLMKATRKPLTSSLMPAVRSAFERPRSLTAFPHCGDGTRQLEGNPDYVWKRANE